ncbi:MAG: M20/M25/M40 family metallo-hydrolase [Veillonella sp.]|nr:M20/M25/M40 family metallo-hydrolase [Veillonella sp.]
MHAHPELSNQEYDTTEFIREQLAKLDIQIMETTRPLRTGVIAFIGQGQSSKNLYLRGDIDALPMEEQSDLAFMSQNQGVAHTCGHDIHTTALLYAAKFLKQYESLIDGRLFFIFQPAEENMTGALEVIDPVYLRNIHQHISWDCTPGRALMRKNWIEKRCFFCSQ